MNIHKKHTLYLNEDDEKINKNAPSYRSYSNTSDFHLSRPFLTPLKPPKIYYDDSLKSNLSSRSMLISTCQLQVENKYNFHRRT